MGYKNLEHSGKYFPEPDGSPMPTWKLTRACNRGEFKTARKVGKRWFIHESELNPIGAENAS